MSRFTRRALKSMPSIPFFGLGHGAHSGSKLATSELPEAVTVASRSSPHFDDDIQTRTDGRSSGSGRDHDVKVNPEPVPGLPFDILIQIFVQLDLADVLSVSKVCRHFHDAACAFPVWLRFAAETQRSFGFLALDPLKLCVQQPQLHHQQEDDCGSGDGSSVLTAADLRHAVGRTQTLHENWLKEYAKPLESTSLSVKNASASGVTPTGLVTPNSNAIHANDARFFVSERYLVHATPGCAIEALDLQTGTKLPSDYFVRSDSALSSGFTLHESGVFLAEYRSDLEAGDESTGPILSFNVICIQMRSHIADVSLHASAVAQFCLPGNYVFVQDVLEPTSRLLCALLLDMDTLSLYLYVIFDWETGLSVKLFISNLDERRSAASEGLRVSEDASGRYYVTVTFPSMLTRYAERVFPLDALRDSGHATPWSPGPARCVPHPDAAQFERRTSYRDQRAVDYDSETLCYAQIPQRGGCVEWVRRGRGRGRGRDYEYDYEYDAPKVCHVQLHASHHDDAHDAGGRQREWALAQHYAPAALRAMPLAFGPLDPSHRRSLRGLVVRMRDPVLVVVRRRGSASFNGGLNPGDAVANVNADVDADVNGHGHGQGHETETPPPLPLLALSHTHAAWIEQFEARRRGRRIGRKLRVLKVLAFRALYEDAIGVGVGVGVGPSALVGQSDTADARAMEVDVPKKILNDARHLLIEPAACAVVVVGEKGQVHRFRFA